MTTPRRHATAAPRRDAQATSRSVAKTAPRRDAAVPDRHAATAPHPVARSAPHPVARSAPDPVATTPGRKATSAPDRQAATAPDHGATPGPRRHATSASRRQPGTAPLRYVALGDSFTAGAEGSREPSFADRLAELLREANPALEYTNLAVPGARTMEVATEQLPACLALEPDVVTLVCGGNDALLAVRPDVHAHMVGFDSTLDALATALPHAVVATATTPDPGRFLSLRPRSAGRITRAIERINDATRAAAARHGVPCLDLAASPEALARGSYARDGYHPAPEACRRAAAAFGALIGLRLGIQLDTPEVI